ncbi:MULTISPECIES: ComEC/Rec2 family competence protein [unclassified Arthrobacter]|uniref:ComEC/Rec2 family competence protein n=1 Tax=unclassified Arthrobacter TaxID=235627 RepID=UPI002E0B0CCB|nr:MULTISPECIES: ComEC/Rec2 family competence protein [unclassified Arthrobacter]MEC5191288.1 competence protein ComEC [Arthrobacter sp. MP_M4]MEC5202961.1 competence protein ComEC [Arthrobacter sp. MP_M7]
MERASRWQQYIDAALGRGPGNDPEAENALPPPGLSGPPGPPGQPGQPGPLGQRPRRVRFRDLIESFPGPARSHRNREHLLRRTDVRLVPSAVLVWATAAAAPHLNPAQLAVLGLSFLAGAGLLLLRAGSVCRRRKTGGPARRSFLATLAVALLLAAATAGHAAAESAAGNEEAVSAAAAGGHTVAVEVEVSGAPRRLTAPGRSGLSDRWAVPATMIEMTFDAHRVRAPARLLVLGGADWEHANPGIRIRTTGKLKPPGPGQAEAAVLSASSAPLAIGQPGPWQYGPRELRSRFSDAAGQFAGDARGLLPGMVTGDTSSVDPDLDTAMKTVGMTHLTAVSGANCSIILGAFLLGARSLRSNRAVTAVLCLGGLALFVLMVGPDASVLRAAVMGAIGLVALAGGRPGRGLSLLCLAVAGLVLAQPALAISFGFLLSVLATLGIVMTGRAILGWFPEWVPRWAAAGVAVPLSAQTFCGPVIVLLQPQFSAYALPANIAAAVLVAPVTLLGTAAVPLAALAPALATVPLAVAAAFANGVGGIARFFAGLPGAVLPWPEGAFGVATMTLFSAAALAACWLGCHPARTVGLARAAHERTVAMLDRMLPPHDRGGTAMRGRRSGLVHRPGRGRLRTCKQPSGRKPQWLLPRPHAPGPRRRIPPPGVM